jgi:membrane protein required for colicin V production
MNTLDIILLVAAGIGMIYGFKAGLVKQLTLGAGIILGLLQATIFYRQAGDWLLGATGWESWICYPIGFMAILLAVAAVVNIAGMLLRLLLKIVLLGIVDRILGAVFSAFIALVIVVFGVKTSNSIIPGNEITGETSQQESLLYSNIAEMTTAIIEEVKEEVDDVKEEVKEELEED